MAGVVSSTEDQVSWFCSVFFHFAANFQSIQIQMLLSSSISTFPLLLFLFIFGFKFLWQWETKTWFSELVLRVWVVPSSWHLPPLVAQTLRHIGSRAPWRAHLGVATLGIHQMYCLKQKKVELQRQLKVFIIEKPPLSQPALPPPPCFYSFCPMDDPWKEECYLIRQLHNKESRLSSRIFILTFPPNDTSVSSPPTWHWAKAQAPLSRLAALSLDAASRCSVAWVIQLISRRSKNSE